MSSSADRVRTSIERSGDGVVLRKRATGPASGRRLTHEAEMLTAGRHPGVVQVADRRGDGPTLELDLTWAGAHTVDTAPRLPVSEVAGLAASLTTTLADLHDLGVVHGRVSPEHVVIGVDGRPILCGWGGAAMAALGGEPAVDVAAVGELITHLVGGASEVEPIPEHRWWRVRRWDGYHRRTLLNLADHASDPDPDRRPSARALADAITKAVPSARLPADRPRLGGPAGVPASAAAVPRPRRGPTNATVDVRKASGTGRRRSGPLVGGDANRDAPTEPAALGPTPDLIPETAEPTMSSDPPSPSTGEPPPPPPAGVDGVVLVDLADPDEGAWRAPQEASTVDGPQRPATLDPRALREAPTAPAGQPDDAPREPVATQVLLAPKQATEPGDRSARVGRSRPTSPVPPTAASPRRRPRRVAVGALAGLLAVAFLAFGVLGGADHRTAPAPTEATAAARSRSCPTIVGAGADVDGDGCAELLVVDGRRVKAGDRHFVVGRAGDRLAVGDWDCDGEATLAVLRPSTGAVYTFAGWPAGHDAAAVTEVARVSDATGVASRAGASPTCPMLVVERGTRPARVLDLGSRR